MHPEIIMQLARQKNVDMFRKSEQRRYYKEAREVLREEKSGSKSLLKRLRRSS